jgi:Bifunctional DNA primase/polymerase, N-terminal
MNLDGDFPHEAPGPAALAYAGRGWQVLPLWWPTPTGACACGLPDCESVGKHPIWRLVPHGLHDATSRVETVREWWRSVPHANIGIRTGIESGLVVLDVDGRAGWQALQGLAATHGPLTACWTRTGSGGWHAYLAHPGGTVSNSAGRLGEGLDVRGDGGYVVAPPSRHRSGCRYRWVGPRDDVAACDVTGELPPMPGWLIELATPSAPASSESRQIRLCTDDVPAYAAAAVEREAIEVALAPAGQRNHRLNRAAFKLGQLVGAGLLDLAAATDTLVAAGLAAGPGERKIRSTVRRGLRAGMHHPRRVRLT